MDEFCAELHRMRREMARCVCAASDSIPCFQDEGGKTALLEVLRGGQTGHTCAYDDDTHKTLPNCWASFLHTLSPYHALKMLTRGLKQINPIDRHSQTLHNL